ncbi:hypothetical protein PPMP20_00055 [Paraburkholderia phymatum]|uniref:DUF4148 domain-containing protein n=1 Tax=Paraburkholderia phymatum (strain DSM 17167 / CIP 108236 / LMG 21445 / STM815) TaxID=391038 RepID=B2JV71_PARP8|nr:hypothetical protein [Paraburkholderia phymatum]ACC74848.1 hypothetical protein Bphy_5782 [Paraburkholderia phymatum STM815]
MKTMLILCGGVLCLSTMQAYAQETTTTPHASTATPETTINSEGPGMSSTSMSGGMTTSHGKSRADVYQDLVHSQQSGEAQRLNDLFKGGN